MSSRAVDRRSLGDASYEEEREWVQVTNKKKSKGKEVCSEVASNSDVEPKCLPKSVSGLIGPSPLGLLLCDLGAFVEVVVL